MVKFIISHKRHAFLHIQTNNYLEEEEEEEEKKKRIFMCSKDAIRIEMKLELYSY
jgi:hypothetical protein